MRILKTHSTGSVIYIHKYLCFLQDQICIFFGQVAGGCYPKHKRGPCRATIQIHVLLK